MAVCAMLVKTPFTSTVGVGLGKRSEIIASGVLPPGKLKSMKMNPTPPTRIKRSTRTISLLMRSFFQKEIRLFKLSIPKSKYEETQFITNRPEED